MHPRELFETSLDLIERTVERVCRRAQIFGPDAEDFGSSVKIALMENDYAILRGWEQRSSLSTYFAVIVQRMLADETIRSVGRWHPSAEATRMGEAAVLAERLIHRNGRSLEEALPIVAALDPAITRARLAEIVARLPERTRRPRAVELDDAAAAVLPAAERADERIVAGETRRTAERAAAVVRDTLDAGSLEDRTLIWLRFGSAMSIADISRMMRLPQRPLYRRLEALLARLRSALLEAGIDAAALGEVIGAGPEEVDFGFQRGKWDALRQTETDEGAREAREQP
jgi:DNA-directed RNA polymerase specialized sigma24 family protein